MLNVSQCSFKTAEPSFLMHSYLSIYIISYISYCSVKALNVHLFNLNSLLTETQKQQAATEADFCWCSYTSGKLECVRFIPLHLLLWGTLAELACPGGWREGGVVLEGFENCPPVCITCQISIVGGEADYLAWTLCFEIWNQTAAAPCSSPDSCPCVTLQCWHAPRGLFERR